MNAKKHQRLLEKFDGDAELARAHWLQKKCKEASPQELAKLDALSAMGFTFHRPKKGLKLLRKHDGDLDAVVAKVLRKREKKEKKWHKKKHNKKGSGSSSSSSDSA